MRAKDRRHGDVVIGGAPPARRWWPWALGFVVAACLVFVGAKLGGGSHPRARPAVLRAGAHPAMRSSGFSGLQTARADALDDYSEPSAVDTAQPPQTAWIADEQLPAVEAFKAPAPAPAATTAEAQAAAEPSMPAVAFLFLTINGEVTWPEVWAAFFAGASDPRMFNVYIHRSSEPGENEEPSPAALQFLAACRGRAFSVPTAPDTAWGQLIAAERSLAAAALNQTENVQFVVQSHTTLPVKSFSDVYETMTARDSSSFCMTTQQTWVRSRLDADAIFPKTAQWISLNRDSAERFADVSRGDAVALVNQACGGSWRQCYPATSEELVMAAITGPVPASAMGSDWLASHPPPGGGPDNALVTALLNEAAAEVDDGGAANATLAMAGVNGGGIPVRDVGATNQGVCDTWHWWDDFPSDAKREPAFEPLQLLVDAVKASGGASPETDAETILEQHVDRFWSPPWHPQELRGGGMTEQFLLDGLCASKSLFARKFSAEFTLRPAPVPRNAAGEWDCPSEDWKASPHEKLDGVSCDGMRHAPIQGVGLAECRQLCCAMGRDRCTAWQYRGRWSAYHACWLGREAGRCSPYDEAKAQLWRGERLLPEPEPLPQNASAVERQRVVDAFTRCFQRRSTAAVAEPELVIDGAAAAPAPAEAAPMSADAEEETADAAPLPVDAAEAAGDAAQLPADAAAPTGEAAEVQAERESDESSVAEAGAEEGSGAVADESSSSSEEQAPQQP